MKTPMKSIRGFRQVALWNALLGLVGIPMNLMIAAALAGGVAAIAAGDRALCLANVAMFALCSAVKLLATMVKKTHVARMSAGAAQEYKQSLYRRFMLGNSPAHRSNPSGMATLFRKHAGEVTAYHGETLPAFWIAVAGYAAYMLYVCLVLRGWLFALCMTGFGLLSLLQPIILEKFLMKNFIAAGEAEAGIADHLAAGREGFAAMKLMNLHGWYMNRYRELQKKMWKLGMKASLCGTVSSTMEDINRFLQTLGLVTVLGWAILRGWTDFEAALQIFVLSASVYGYLSTVLQMKQNSATYRAARQQIDGQLPEAQPSAVLAAGDVQGAVRASGLHYEAEGKVLLQNAEFFLNPGEKCLLQGENGAGKSTLLSLLLGELTPGAGEILVDGHAAQDVRALRELIAWCPQAAPALSCSARELFDAALKAQPCISRERLREYGRALNLVDEDMDKPLTALSGGTQKKAALSLALAKDAPLLLLDEPEAMLDQAAAGALLEILRKQQRTMLIVSHNAIYEDLASVRWTLNAGKLTRTPCAR